MFGLRVALVPLLATGLAGCTLAYPRFDSLLNPDIAIPNAGEVVDSVKCAVTTFYIERASRIRGKAEAELEKLLGGQRGAIEKSSLCPKDWKKAYIVLRKKKSPSSCEDFAILEGTPTREHVEAAWGCDPPYKILKHVRLEKTNGNKYRCIWSGGCRPGTRLDKEKCTLEDRGEFALDPTGKAKIELSLAAVNTGAMNYQKIDATGFLPYIIVPGDSAKGFPFPMLKMTDKKTNKVELTLTMPQAGSIAIEVPNEVDDKEVFERRIAFDHLWREKEKEEARKSSLMYSQRHGSAKLKVATQEHTEKAKQKLLEEIGEGYKKCSALKIDFLGLSNYINNIVSDQESNVHKGGLEVALDSMVLTSQFQLTFDATAGTQHLLRIVPVLQPPVLGLNPDHTHALKLTFAGRKGRAFANNAKSLMEKCKDRFRGLYESLPRDKQAAQKEKIDDLCGNPQTVLIESLIEAVEGIKAGSSSN